MLYKRYLNLYFLISRPFYTIFQLLQMTYSLVCITLLNFHLFIMELHLHFFQRYVEFWHDVGSCLAGRRGSWRYTLWILPHPGPALWRLTEKLLLMVVVFCRLEKADKNIAIAQQKFSASWWQAWMLLEINFSSSLEEFYELLEGGNQHYHSLFTSNYYYLLRIYHMLASFWVFYMK